MIAIRLMTPRNFFLVAASASSASGAKGASPPETSRSADVPSRLIFEEVVTLGSTEVIGHTPRGTRKRLPITGGRFYGLGLSGCVLSGGADWQLVRADGSLAVNAEYMIETDDHVLIHVHNVGVITHRKGKKAYLWAAPRFEAPMGKYDWLNDAIFVSKITPVHKKEHRAVRITIYRIG